jgi:hypothetical protein
MWNAKSLSFPGELVVDAGKTTPLPLQEFAVISSRPLFHSDTISVLQHCVTCIPVIIVSRRILQRNCYISGLTKPVVGIWNFFLLRSGGNVKAFEASCQLSFARNASPQSG